MSFKTLFSVLIIVIIFGASISGCSKSCTELKLDMLDEMAEKCEDLEKNEIKDGKVNPPCKDGEIILFKKVASDTYKDKFLFVKLNALLI
jgi:hypothetical protein